MGFWMDVAQDSHWAGMGRKGFSFPALLSGLISEISQSTREIPACSYTKWEF